MLHARFPQNGWPPYAHFWLGEFQKWPTATAPGSSAKIHTSVGSEPRGPKKFVASEPRGTKEWSEKGKKRPSPANPEAQNQNLGGPKKFVASEPRGIKK